MARGKKKKEQHYKNPNGYGTVYKLSGNRRKPYYVRVTDGWELSFDDNNIPHKRQLYIPLGSAETYDEGMQMLKEYNERKRMGFDALKPTVTFGDLYDIAIPRHIADLNPSTVNGYNAAKKRLEPIFKTPIRDLKTNVLQQLIDNVYTIEHVGKRVLECIKTSCSIVFDYAEQNDIVTKNYANYVKIPKIETVSKKRPFTPAEIDILTNHDSLLYVDTILILIYTGLRIDELLMTRIEDVYLDDRYFITGSKTDAGKDRIIPIPHRIDKYIRKWYDKNQTYLIHDDNGNRISQYYYRDKIFKPLLVTLGIPAHLPHECRHTFATITDNAGINRVAQQKIIGHKGKGVTERTYIHKDVQDLVDEIDRVLPQLH